MSPFGQFDCFAALGVLSVHRNPGVRRVCYNDDRQQVARSGMTRDFDRPDLFGMQLNAVVGQNEF